MDGKRFERLKASVTQVTADQCVELEALVEQVGARRQGEIAVARRVKSLDETRCCPHCGHADVVRHGYDKAGRQRFRCREGAGGGCGKTFNALTGTPFARMRMPEKWAGYARLMDRFMSLDKIVETGIGISRHTAWRWRHRMLHAQAALQSDKVVGVVEADEKFPNLLQGTPRLEARRAAGKPPATLPGRPGGVRWVVQRACAGAHGVGPLRRHR